MQWAQLAIAFLGEQKASQMSAKQLELLGKQLADLQGIKLPDLQEVQPEQLGKSAVAGMQSDQGLRGKQLQAITELQHIIDSGGLDLSDKVSLEEALSTAQNNQRRARAGVAGDLQARGGLDTGARLVMGLDAATAGANELRKTGMETAAMAQRRKLEAIRAASGMSGALREQDWREKETSSRAKDLRDERNSAAREKAGYYNAGLPQQGFNNAVTKATGQQTGVNAMAQGLNAAAQDTRASAAGMAGVVGAYGNVDKNAAGNTGVQTYTHEGSHSSGSGSHADEEDDGRDH